MNTASSSPSFFSPIAASVTAPSAVVSSSPSPDQSQRRAYEKYVMFPIKYPEMWKLHKAGIDVFWTVEEVDLTDDYKHWVKLTDGERKFLSHVIAFFAASDGIVTENLALRFFKDVEIAEARAFYSFQMAMENIHSEMYSLLIEELIKDNDEKDRLFNAVVEFPCIGRKAAWAKRWIEDETATFATRLVAFACVEGIFFSSSFASINWIKQRGILPGLTTSNGFISRDEALHTDFAVLVYAQLVPDEQKLSPEVFADLVREATSIEIEFITDALPCRLIGMNADLMVQYIKFVADRLCVQLGYDKCFNTSSVCPLDFMIAQSTDVKINFFERPNIVYSLANYKVDENVDVFDGTTDF